MRVNDVIKAETIKTRFGKRLPNGNCLKVEGINNINFLTSRFIRAWLFIR
ncbi:50S ribosomal protein L14 [Psychrobacter sp. 1501(2011)]|nr:50S ribosomal protein L14 [Psychrobacter sp. 1501(2011)]